MSTNVLIGVLIYVVVGAVAYCVTNMIYNRVFPALTSAESYGVHITAQTAIGTFCYVVVAFLLFTLAWWLLILISTYKQYYTFNENKWFM